MFPCRGEAKIFLVINSGPGATIWMAKPNNGPGGHYLVGALYEVIRYASELVSVEINGAKISIAAVVVENSLTENFSTT